MDSLNFWIGVAGLVLGLISAWPRLVSWFNSARNVYSARAQKSAARHMARLELFAKDPSYLIAYTTRAVVFGAFVYWLATLLKGVAVEDKQVYLIIYGVRLFLSLISGGILGGVLGLVVVTVWQKEKDALSDG